MWGWSCELVVDASESSISPAKVVRYSHYGPSTVSTFTLSMIYPWHIKSVTELRKRWRWRCEVWIVGCGKLVWMGMFESHWRTNELSIATGNWIEGISRDSDWLIRRIFELERNWWSRRVMKLCREGDRICGILWVCWNGRRDDECKLKRMYYYVMRLTY